MFFPFDTNAMAHCRPLATLSLIALNIAAYFLLSQETQLDLILNHEEGLQPVQWVTSNFIHADFFHLLFNMIFLWVFGLIVEGKARHMKFLGIYLGIATAQCFLEQILFWGSEGSSLGASAAIYGLIGIALLWAPHSLVRVFYFWTPYYWGVHEMKLINLALIYFGIDLVLLFFGGALGSWYSTEALLMMGAGLGIGVGWISLKRNLVDCIGEDWLTLKENPYGEAGRTLWRGDNNPEETGDEDEPVDTDLQVELIRASLAESDYVTAFGIYREAPEPYLPEPDLARLAIGLFEQKKLDPSYRLMREHIQRFPAGEPRIRVIYAAYLLRSETRPAAALRLLGSVPPGTDLDDEVKTMVSEAERLKAQGVLEFDPSEL